MPGSGGDEVVARHADTEVGGEAVVKGNEVALERPGVRFVQLADERAQGAIALDKGPPGRFAVGFAVERRAMLEGQIEMIAEKLLYALSAAPLEGRRGWRAIGRRM